MNFARLIGLNVPQTQVIDLDSIDGLPADLPAFRADEPRKAYIISRFDRGGNFGRLHVEDFNQIANQKPDEKYDHKTSSWIANVITTICPSSDVDDFVRRLVFGICIGNGDIHLKTGQSLIQMARTRDWRPFMITYALVRTTPMGSSR